MRATTVKLPLVLLMALACLAFAPSAFAGSGPSVTGAVYTTFDAAVDGSGHCKNSVINCNIYDGKQYVWLNGGPTVNHLTPAGLYFFVVLKPGGQPNPNDPSTSTPNADNLSCPTVGCADPYTNRTFTISSTGEISAYSGTHDKDTSGGSGMLIRLCNGGGCPPYIDTPNPGGEYDMAVCYLGPDAAHITYPVDTNKVCKHDNFKVQSATAPPPPDKTPPTCSLALKGINGSGYVFIQVSVGDADSGLNTITITKSINANVTLPTFTLGSKGPFTVTATRIVKTSSAFLALLVTDAAGNQTVCDPALGTLKASNLGGSATRVFTGLDVSEGFVRIANGHSGFSHVVLVVNGRTFRLNTLRAGITRIIDVRSALRPGGNNRISVRGLGGRPGATATILISN